MFNLNLLIMNKITLSLILICSFIYLNTVVSAQNLQSENFDALTVGNVGTDITGNSAGQGGLIIQATAGSGQNSDFQIVNEGGSQGNVLQITGSATATGNRFVWKDELNTSWASRTSGNDVIEVEYDFFTGAASTSKNSSGVRIYNSSFQTIGGFSFNPETKILTGLARQLNDMGTAQLYRFSLGSNNTAITLVASTWYRIGLAFNKTTGEVIWRGPGFYTGANSSDSGADPFEVDFIVLPGTGNALSFNAKVDDYTIKATATEDLLDTKDYSSNLADRIKLFPNPVEDILHFSISNSTAITKVEFIDSNGKLVKSIPIKNIYNNPINTSELSKGLYLLNIFSVEGKATKKFIKN